MACPAHDAILTWAATAAVVAAEDDGPRLNATLSATGDRAAANASRRRDPGLVNGQNSSGDERILHSTRLSQPGRNHCCVWLVTSLRCEHPAWQGGSGDC
jgi:hypothetical protein